MNESIDWATRLQNTRKFREQYISRVFGIENETGLEALMELSGHDAIEAARLYMSSQGVTDFEEQKPVLHRIFQDLEDPGRHSL